MNILAIIWLSSFLVLATIGFVALRRFRTLSTLAVVRVHEDFGSFISHESKEIAREMQMHFHSVRPHAEYFGNVVFSGGKRGYDIFIERIFGKIEIEKGKATSFFLKHIAEHKEFSMRNRSDPMMK